jgi:predicted metal-binding protein
LAKSLSPGERVRFGLLSSLFTLKEFNIIICTSCLPNNEVSIVRNAVKKLDNARLVDAWNSEVTHLVIKDGKLTIKVANALAKCVPIVSSTFVQDLVKCVESNQVCNYQLLCVRFCLLFVSCFEWATRFDGIIFHSERFSQGAFRNACFSFRNENQHSTFQ